MTDYNKGKIYRIVCNITGITYYGSTCEPTLARRLTKHVSDYKSFKEGKRKISITSFEVLEGGNYAIVLVELAPCNTKMELQQRERFYIENNDCVNKVIPTRTQAEYLNANKIRIDKHDFEYRLKNNDTIKARNNSYKLNNIDKVKAGQANYMLLNRDKKNARRVKSRLDNPERYKIENAKYNLQRKERLAKLNIAIIQTHG